VTLNSLMSYSGQRIISVEYLYLQNFLSICIYLFY